MRKTVFSRRLTTGLTEYSDTCIGREVRLSNLLSTVRLRERGRELLLRPKRGEAIASVFLSFIATSLIVLFYSLDPFRSWTLLVGVWAGSEVVILCLLQNQRQNEKEFQKHPVSFPNPEGGGLLGEYVMRPWQNELAELGRRYPGKKAKKQKKKD